MPSAVMQTAHLSAAGLDPTLVYDHAHHQLISSSSSFYCFSMPPSFLTPFQEYTRKKIGDFLHSHTAYELIPESGKLVVVDVDLPVRQAFHALHEQVGLLACLPLPSTHTP